MLNKIYLASMDIRNFFGRKSADKPTSSKATSHPKKKRLVISDSDDDDIIELPVK